MRSDGEGLVQSPKPTQRPLLTAIHRKATFGDLRRQFRAAKRMRYCCWDNRCLGRLCFSSSCLFTLSGGSRRGHQPPQQAKLSPLSIPQKTIRKPQPRALPLAERLFPPQPAQSTRKQPALQPLLLHWWFACLYWGGLLQGPKLQKIRPSTSPPVCLRQQRRRE